MSDADLVMYPFIGVATILLIVLLFRAEREPAWVFALGWLMGVGVTTYGLIRLYHERPEWWAEENLLLIGTFVLSIVGCLFFLLLIIDRFAKRRPAPRTIFNP